MIKVTVCFEGRERILKKDGTPTDRFRLKNKYIYSSCSAKRTISGKIFRITLLPAMTWQSHVYHNLWRIEESFRIMKSELEARPVYLKLKITIYGHFLICYLSTLIIRLLQIYELKDQDSYQEIFKFIREFYFIIIGNKYINMATRSDFITKLAKKTKLPLMNAMISQKQYEKIMSCKL